MTVSPSVINALDAGAVDQRQRYSVKRTVRSDFREIVAELRQSRDIIYQFVLRDIRIRYKQALLGFAWALLMPASIVLAGLAMRVAISYVAGRPIVSTHIAGMAIKAVPWGFFMACLGTTTATLVSNNALVTKIYFPREVLPLSAVIAQSFDSGIGLLLVLVIMPFLHVTPSPQLLWMPLLLAILWTHAIGLGLFLSCLNLFFRDVKYLVQMVVTFGIFATPVLLDAGMYGPKGAVIMLANPVGAILEGLRLSVVEHHNLLQPLWSSSGVLIWHPLYLAHTLMWALIVLVGGSIFFHRSERRFAELV